MLAAADLRLADIPEQRGSLPGTLAADPHRSLLLLRFALVNMVGTALAGAAWQQGWVERALAGDTSGLGKLIVATFLVGLALCARATVDVSRELDAVRANRPSPGSRVARHLAAIAHADGATRAGLEGALKLLLANRIGVVRNIASSLVLLGLIGTVLGFIMALDGVDASTAGDVAQVGRMVAALVEGMGVALYTTLLGAVLNIWLMIDYRLLEGGTVRLLAALMERGARDAGA
jgi:biopolymer transport protein ExbB/TolQ